MLLRRENVEMGQSLLIILRIADVLRAPSLPAASQFAVLQAVGLVEHLELDDSLCAEVPEAPTQLAPGNQQATRLGIAEDHRPYRSIGFVAGLGPVAEPQFQTIADRRSEACGIDALL
jgi:hypothetical protein